VTGQLATSREARIGETVGHPEFSLSEKESDAIAMNDDRTYLSSKTRASSSLSDGLFQKPI
jgi:hypothetical protein